MDCMYQDLGLLVIRVTVGMVFAKHGIDKILGGKSVWVWAGEQMKHFGIAFLPLVWGFLAAMAECFGGAALMLGVYTRLAAMLLSCVMIVALRMHCAQKDSFMVYSPALTLLGILVGFMIAGGGSYAIIH